MNKSVTQGRLHQRVAMAGGNVYMVSQHAIIFDLQRFDAGFLAIAVLQAGYDASAFITQAPRRIQSGIIAIRDKPAIARQKRRLCHQSKPQHLGQSAYLFC